MLDLHYCNSILEEALLMYPDPFYCSSYRPVAGTVWSSMRTSFRSCCQVLKETVVPHRGRGGTGGRSLRGGTKSPLSCGRIPLQIWRSWFIWLIYLMLSQMMRSSRRASRCLSGERELSCISQRDYQDGYLSILTQVHVMATF